MELNIMILLKVEYELDNDYVVENLVLHEYKKPKYHISVQ